MARPRKDAKYLNVYIERSIHERFDAFCNNIGQSKTIATERALSLYMDEMEKKFMKDVSDNKDNTDSKIDDKKGVTD